MRTVGKGRAGGTLRALGSARQYGRCPCPVRVARRAAGRGAVVVATDLRLTSFPSPHNHRTPLPAPCSYEREGRARKTVRAQQLWFAVLEAQMETGTPYMLYKDACNMKSNQQVRGLTHEC